MLRKQEVVKALSSKVELTIIAIIVGLLGAILAGSNSYEKVTIFVLAFAGCFTYLLFIGQSLPLRTRTTKRLKWNRH